MKEKGITLIALVITIIVLLILAAVSIATLTGENGVISKAREAREKTEQAKIEEQVKLAILGSYDWNGKVDFNQLKMELEKIPGKGTITDTNGEFPIIVTVDGYTFEIDDKGNIVLKGGNQGEEAPNPPVEETGITAADIASSSDKTGFYGAIVTGYTCTNSVGVNAWKIFYADEENIYLIADDYIASTYAPKGKGGSSLGKGHADYNLFFNINILSDYEGSSDITDERIKALNSDYFTKGYTSTNNNMKAVAYMLDTSAWIGFAGNNADYAIGGPTVEMLLKSYSQKYNVDYRAQASSDIGYQISEDGGTTWEDYYDRMLDTSDSLFVIRNTTAVDESMWLASPSANGTDYVMGAGNDGFAGRDHYMDTGAGFRPLVCLNSNVQLEKNSNGIYAIK